MPYYIFIVTHNDANQKSAKLVSEYENYRDAKTEVKRLRSESPLAENEIYKINFSPSAAAAEKTLTEFREEPIVKEWEK